MADMQVPGVALVRQLVAEQQPQLAHEEVVELQTVGTDNAIFRIGQGLVARFPKDPSDDACQSLRAELRAMAEFGQASPFACPAPVHLGEPSAAYPQAWSIVTWLPGEIADPHRQAGDAVLAEDLVVLIQALRGHPTGGQVFHGSGRGGVLTDHDDWVEECIRESQGLLDTAAMSAAWKELRVLPSCGPDVMSHTDLIPGNLLVSAGRLAGVLDTGGFQPADPALDLVCAWHLFDAPAREVLRSGLGCSDLEWARGMAWAFEQASGLVWYYQDTNPPMAKLGRASLARILAEGGWRSTVGAGLRD